jgi:hypothetical protein
MIETPMSIANWIAILFGAGGFVSSTLLLVLNLKVSNDIAQNNLKVNSAIAATELRSEHIVAEVRLTTERDKQTIMAQISDLRLGIATAQAALYKDINDGYASRRDMDNMHKDNTSRLGTIEKALSEIKDDLNEIRGRN